MQTKKLPIDYTILFLLGCFLLFSVLAIYSGSAQYASGDPTFFVKRQIVWYVVGIVVMIVIAYVDFELIEKWTLVLYVIGTILLVLVHFYGKELKGAQRWLDLGFTDIQPSEFMKIFLILHIASILNKLGKYRLSFKDSIWVTMKVLFYSAIPLYLIFEQPDLGSTLMIAFAVFGLLFVSSISIKMILLLVSLAATGLGTLIFLYFHHFELFSKVIKSHQMPRIYGWLNPEMHAQGFGFQLRQSLLGIGSGQLTGSGFNQGFQAQSGRIPEAQTDFIFAVIGEEFGFIGASILVCLFFLLIYRIITIAFHANSLFGVYICVGVIGLIAFQVFQNIGMTIGLMPITGLALPFISYGGSALITNMMALGLVTSVHLRTKSYMFSNEEAIR